MCGHVAKYLEDLEGESDLLMPTNKLIQKEKQESVTKSPELDISAIIAKLKLGIQDTQSTKHIEVSSRPIEHFAQLVDASRALKDRYNIRLVLIFDNLDTFCYEHERYILFQKGFDKLQSKINFLHMIFWRVTNNLLNSEMSFIFTARPYVYAHVFQSQVQDIPQGRISSIYALKQGDLKPDLPITTRLEMLKALAVKLKNINGIPEGKKKAVTKLADEFIAILSTIIAKKKEPFNKFFPLANQGFRSMVDFYQELEHHRDIFPRYFTHDVLYLYMLGKRSLYGQMLPPGIQLKQMSYFPNIFLINCDNVHNMSYAEACKPHRLTFWLKYLILLTVNCKREATIRYVLDILKSYDEHVVRLCLGSLSTSNEYNCLNFHFPMHTDSMTLPQIERSTSISLTNRGKYLLEDNYCLGFECLQLYFDDWLMPRPRIDQLPIENKSITVFLKPDIDNNTYSYDYLLNGDAVEYDKRRREIINIKSKQALILLAFLRSAQKYEMKAYAGSWNDIRNLVTRSNKELLSENIWGQLQDRIIDNAHRSSMKSGDLHLKAELEFLKNTLNANLDNFDQFFNKIFT